MEAICKKANVKKIVKIVRPEEAARKAASSASETTTKDPQPSYATLAGIKDDIELD